MKKLFFSLVLMSFTLISGAKEIHVSTKGNDNNDGSASKPFKTINAAAQIAVAGDEVIVHEGIYREWINPKNGGKSSDKRIVYRAAKGEDVEIKGSEIVKGWEQDKKDKNVWKVVLPNSFFNGTNSFNEKIEGDWFSDHGRIHHTAEVYLNDRSFYEIPSVEKVFTPDTIKTHRDPEGTTQVWYAEVDDNNTTIWARFGKVNPNKELVEVAVRPTCFFPTTQGLNYITIDGFRISQAATQWGAPTAHQIGMVATHWCKGWIIENNTIKNSRCSGITLGKEKETGHNLDVNDPRLDGTLHYIEVIHRTLSNNWDKEHIGSHIVRNNVISDCEQTAMCGSMGAAFSEIYGNHIFNIHVKRQFSGAEMGGIKFHGALDTYIHNNRIHDCILGVWLDWMAQGSRISSNLMYNNIDQDIFMEVNHGPFMIDNNLLLSKGSYLDVSDGGAFVHNIFSGSFVKWDEPNRYTPYQLPHSTTIKGYSIINNGDHRYYNNIFIGNGNAEDKRPGLLVYEKSKQPIFASGNIFCNEAKSVNEDQGVVVKGYNPNIKIEEIGNEVFISFNADESGLASLKTEIIDNKKLGNARLTGLPYENLDGTPISITKDYFGKMRGSNPIPGAIELTSSGSQRLKVW